MVGDSIGGVFGMRGRHFIEFAHGVGAGEFTEDGADAVAVMGIVVLVCTMDGLKGRAKFMPPVFAHFELNVREDDEHSLSFAGGDAVRMHSRDFGADELLVGDGLLLEVESEGEDGYELVEDVAGIWAVSALDGSSDELMKFVVVNGFIVHAVGGA